MGQALEDFKQADLILQRLKNDLLGGGGATTTASSSHDSSLQAQLRHGGLRGDEAEGHGDLEAMEHFWLGLDSPTGNPDLPAAVDPEAEWLQQLAAPTRGIKHATAIQAALQGVDRFKDFAFGCQGSSLFTAAYKGSLCRVHVYMAKRMTAKEQQHGGGGDGLFPCLVQVTMEGNSGSAWSKRMEEEANAALLRWRQATQQDTVQTVAAVLEELRLRVHPGTRGDDLTGRALKLAGPSVEPMTPCLPSLGGSSGRGLAYRLHTSVYE